MKTFSRAFLFLCLIALLTITNTSESQAQETAEAKTAATVLRIGVKDAPTFCHV